MKQLFILLFITALAGSNGAELPETVALFGKTELKKELFSSFTLPQEPAARKRVLRKLVDSQVNLIIIRQLLERSGILPSPQTVLRYGALRKKQNVSPLPAALEKEFSSGVGKPEFQLKCALFFTFLAADPALVDPSREAIAEHYLLNREKFRTQAESRVAVLKAGENDSKGKQRSALILSRLRQGEDFYRLAQEFDPEGRKKRNTLTPEQRKSFAAVKNLKPGESTAVAAPEGLFVVKLLSSAPPRPWTLDEAAPYIREILSSKLLKAALEQYIREILAKTPVRYYF